MGLLDDRSAFEEILGEFGSELECSGIAKKSDLTSLLATSPVQLAIRPVLQVISQLLYVIISNCLQSSLTYLTSFIWSVPPCLCIHFAQKDLGNILLRWDMYLVFSFRVQKETRNVTWPIKIESIKIVTCYDTFIRWLCSMMKEVASNQTLGACSS